MDGPEHMVNASEKLTAVRQKMAQHNIAALVVPSADPHQSEYVTGHWQARAWLTGFTGSAGVAVVTEDKAILWTDFRYWIQALSQIRHTEFTLFKSGEPDIPEFHDWIFENVPPKDVVAIDGHVITGNQEKKYKSLWDRRQIRLRTDLDLIGSVWQNRPPLPVTKAWDFSIRFAGQSRLEKMAKIREAMAASDTRWYVMAGLEDIAWTCNLRGSDAPNNPVNIAFALLGLEQMQLFIQPDKVDTDLAAVLAADGIQIADYHDMYTVLEKLPGQDGLLLDPDMVSAALCDAINPACRIIEKNGPATRFKAVKNDTQIYHLRDTAVKDGVAVTQFLHWLDTRNPQESVSETGAAQKLFDLRSRQTDFVDNSFAPIMAYEDHSAMCHYCATSETDVQIRNVGMFLTDSGGNYLTGTTDITRTICMGSPTQQQIQDYTLVLKGHIAVATAFFPKGTRGFQIDTLARQFLWQHGMNFGHGTGHGVGFFLCVHEGPARISPHPVDVALEPGMLLTNEPGLYREGEYGIRLENMILVTGEKQTPFGMFLAFENMTLCHFEKELMDISLLTKAEIDWINQYHQKVFDSLGPHLDTTVGSWLEARTDPL